METNQAKNSVLLIDEPTPMEGLGAILRREGFQTLLLNPQDFTEPAQDYRFGIIVYEPYLAMFKEGERFRPILDKILGRARDTGAKRIAFSSQNVSALQEAGFFQGSHYDVHLQKPTETENILRQIRRQG